MNILSEYKLQLKSLEKGTYSYNYHLDKAFFEAIRGNEVNDGNVDVELNVTRQAHVIEIEISYSGTIETTCDRCLDPLNIDVDNQETVYVKFGEEYSEEDNNLFIIPEDEGIFDISWLLYELLAIEIPICHTHATLEECNAEMIEVLKKHQVDTADESGDNNTETDKVDPRWDALKNILNN